MEYGKRIICKLDYNQLHIPKKFLNIFLEALGKWNIALRDDELVIAKKEFYGDLEWRKEARKSISYPLSLEISGRSKILVPPYLLIHSGIGIGGLVVLESIGDHFRLLPLIVPV